MAANPQFCAASWQRRCEASGNLLSSKPCYTFYKTLQKP
jgi:hypothetical protein